MVCEDIPSHQLHGLGKHVVTLANELLSRGHEVSLLGRTEPDYETCAEEVGFRGEFIAGLDMTHSGWKEPALGIFNPWKRPFFARRIAAAVHRHATDFDVVHYHGHLPMMARYVPNYVPLLQTRHDQGSECIINLRFRNGDVCGELAPAACASCIHKSPGHLRSAISAAAVSRLRRETAEAFARHPVVFVSDFLRRAFLRAVPVADLSGAHVIHNFVNEAALLAAPGTPASDSGVWRIVLAGRVDDAKGFGAFLDLALPRFGKNAFIEVIGDGPALQGIRDRHRGDNVAFRGHQPYAATLAATKSSDIAVVPSIWEEPCGTTILEALRLGKPCFALARGGTPELAIYGAPGQLRLFNDMSALVDSVVDMVRGEKPGRGPVGVRLGPEGGQSADVGLAIERLLVLYDQVAKARTRR